MKIKMPEAEVTERLERIARYNDYHRREGRLQHLMTRPALERVLEEWGADPSRAQGVGVELPRSPFLTAAAKAKPFADEEEF